MKEANNASPISIFFEKKIRVVYNIKKFIEKIICCEKKNGYYINLIFVDDARIRRINTEFKLKKSETDVIAFNYNERKYVGGDIFISVDTAKRNAQKYGEELDIEILRLVAHGVLHVLGYDHSAEFKKTEKMNIRQEKYIKEFLKEC